MRTSGLRNPNHTVPLCMIPIPTIIAYWSQSCTRNQESVKFRTLKDFAAMECGLPGVGLISDIQGMS